MIKMIKPGSLRISHFITVFFLTITVVVDLIFTIVLYQAASRQAMDDIVHRLTDTVAVAAQGLDGDRHGIIAQSRDQNSREYQEFKIKLQHIQQAASDIHFIYTMAKGPGNGIMFVVDAEEDPAQMAAPGEIYKDAAPLLKARFADLSTPLSESEFYTDHWGTWLSGYAPVYDRSGNRAGVLGIDISADTIVQYQKKLLYIFLLIFLLSLPLMVVLSVYLGRKIGAPLKAMKQGADSITAGNLDITLAPPPFKEPASLAAALNHMVRALKKEQKRLKEMALKYRNIFDNATEGIFQTTPSGALLTANKAMIQLLGYASFDEFQRSIHNKVHNIYDQKAHRREFLDQLTATGRVESMPLLMRRKNGSMVWVEVSAHLQDYGGTHQVIEGTLKDITARKEKEKETRKKEAAQAASLAKSEFLANMSHEIRTPLNAVMGLADLLARTDLAPSQQQYLAKIKTSSRTLLAVINDILDFSKIEAGSLALEKTDFSLHELLANISEMFAHNAHEKNIEIMIHIDESTPTALVGDPVRLGQILINLVGNAVKFTENGEIVIHAAWESLPDNNADETTGVKLHFQVTDTGMGIPRDRIPMLFDSFTQADTSTTRRFGGTGLGLSICRRLTQLMGGDISVTSEPGKGSTFSFTVQLQLQPKKKQIALLPPRDMRGLRVLIVDDNLTSLEILSAAVRSFKMEAMTASSGKKALELLAAASPPFDLVLLDWKMPELNGLETARRIKEQLSLNQVPIVCMVSAHAREDLIQYSEKRLLDAFLHKPVNPSFLFDTIMELFGRHDALISRSPADSINIPDQDTSRLKHKKILLVEDNEINREVALEWLKTADIDSLVAVNGKEAVEMIEKHPLDGILMDIQMPEMDGFEATGIIRGNKNFDHIPIIAMTAHALKGDKEKCIKAGMNDHIAKPIDPTILFATLNRWVGGNTDTGENSLNQETRESRSPQRNPVHSGETQPPPCPQNAIHTALPAKQDQKKTDVKKETTLPDMPGIDTRTGLYRVNQNKPLYLKLLKSFSRDFATAEKDIMESLGANDRASARRMVHSIKGVAANIGADDLSACAAELEQQLIHDAPEMNASIFKHFSTSLSRVVTAISGLKEFRDPPPSINQAATSTAPPDDPEKMTSFLDTLRTLLDDDLEKARTLLASHQVQMTQAFGSTAVRGLVEALDNFDIDDAQEQLTALCPGSKKEEHHA